MLCHQAIIGGGVSACRCPGRLLSPSGCCFWPPQATDAEGAQMQQVKLTTLAVRTMALPLCK